MTGFTTPPTGGPTIQHLDSFDVTFEFHRNETTWTIRTGGRDAPVARLHKQAAVNSVKPFEVHGGPGLDRLLGHVAIGIALGPDGARIGTVAHQTLGGLEGGLLTDELWLFRQQDLGVLEGRPVGLGSRARHAFGVGSLVDNGVTDVFLEHRLRYSNADTDGFELTRRSGLRSRYDVRIDDPRVNRLLVLSAVAYFDELHGDSDVRKLLPSIGGLFRR